jgi:glutaconate CoA-transferase subunit B
MKNEKEAPTAYTPAELMVTAAAREIADGEVVFVGMRLPLLGFLLAKSTHAPNAVGIYELGIIRDLPTPAPILTMGDLPNLFRAQCCTDSADVMGLLQQGLVDVSFIGGAQLDRFGNLNTSYIGPVGEAQIRLPGSGGASDLASLSRRHIIVMVHQKRRFVERVNYITSPGYGDGAGWRKAVGLPRGGPSTVITTLGVMGFDPKCLEIVLKSVHPGITVEMVRRKTNWPLKLSENISQTPKPSEIEIELLRKYDPNGFWTKNNAC